MLYCPRFGILFLLVASGENMKVDHIVVHIDNNSQLLDELKKEAERCGFPLDPSKGSRALRLANLWVGDQYVEIPKLMRPDGGGWIPSWVERYNRGTRGTYCLFLHANNLERLQSELAVRGIQSSVEKTSFKTLFGLYTVTMPWQYLRLPPIPGTELEIGFFECEESFRKKYREHVSPDTVQNGIAEISDVDILLPALDEAIPLLKEIFPDMVYDEQTKTARVKMENSELTFSQSPTKELKVILDAAAAREDQSGKELTFQNLTVRTHKRQMS